MEFEKDVPSCIIHEVLAPPRITLPEDVLEVIQHGVEFHNSGQYQKALTSFVDSRKLWSQSTEIPPDGEMYFLIMQGSVCLSMRKDEEGLQKFMTAKQFADLHFNTTTNHLYALMLGCIGGAYAHMLQFSDALVYYKKALRIRQQTLGENHIDTAILRNNIAVCMACTDPITASREEILNNLTAAHTLLYEQLGPNHPRTATALRNLSREKPRISLKYGNPLPSLSPHLIRPR